MSLTESPGSASNFAPAIKVHHPTYRTLKSAPTRVALMQRWASLLGNATALTLPFPAGSLCESRHNLNPRKARRLLEGITA